MPTTQQQIEAIIKTAIKGGYPDHCLCNMIDFSMDEDSYCHFAMFMSKYFWSAIGKAKGWTDSDRYWSFKDSATITLLDAHINNALTFHEINITENLDKAIEYLYNLITKK